MVNPLETAHQSVKAGAGIATVAPACNVTQAHLHDVLQGRKRITAPLATLLSAQTGVGYYALMTANTDEQFLLNRNTTL